MSSSTSDRMDLLFHKINDLMSELYTIHTGEQSIRNQIHEPWSSDMSGPYKYAVFNNDTFVISEVATSQLASAIVGGRNSVDVGENIKLYVNDVTTRKKLNSWGVSPATYREYTRCCICAGSWIIESCANYILRTAEDKGDHDPVQYYEQKSAMMEVFLRLAKFEEISFGLGSNKDYHTGVAKLAYNQSQHDPVNKLFLEVIERYRKNREALLISMANGTRDRVVKDELPMDYSDPKGHGAKLRRNKKKYAKKKAKKQKSANIMDKEEQNDTQGEGVEAEQELAREDYHGADEAQFDTCRDLWRQIMTENPADSNVGGKENQGELEGGVVNVRDFALEMNVTQRLQRPGIYYAETPVPWKEAKRDFHDMMAQYGLQHITFVKDKLKSGEIKRGDGLEVFYNEAVPVDADPHGAP